MNDKDPWDEYERNLKRMKLWLTVAMIGFGLVAIGMLLRLVAAILRLTGH